MFKKTSLVCTPEMTIFSTTMKDPSHLHKGIFLLEPNFKHLLWGEQADTTCSS